MNPSQKPKIDKLSWPFWPSYTSEYILTWNFLYFVRMLLFSDWNGAVNMKNYESNDLCECICKKFAEWIDIKSSISWSSLNKNPEIFKSPELLYYARWNYSKTHNTTSAATQTRKKQTKITLFTAHTNTPNKTKTTTNQERKKLAKLTTKITKFVAV